MGDTAIKKEHATNSPCINMPITVDDLQYLSREIRGEWQDVARKLGLTEGEIHKLIVDYSRREQETIYQMLVLWQQKEGSGATRNVLADALKNADSKKLAEFVLTGVKP